MMRNRSGKDQKIAQSTHENGYIKPRKTFWRNSKQLLMDIKNITKEEADDYECDKDKIEEWAYLDDLLPERKEETK